jgi:thymidylate synthase
MVVYLTCRNVNEAFRVLVETIHKGWIHAEVEASRYGEVIRVPDPVIVTYTCPTERVLFNAARDANPFFSLYESLYFLAGRNDVAPLAYYNSRMVEFSDNYDHSAGIDRKATLNDSYGFRWRYAVSAVDGRDGSIDRADQLGILVDHLRSKPESRRAVLQMWNVEDDLMNIDDSKAVCCNLSAVFRVEWGRCPRCARIASSGVVMAPFAPCSHCKGTPNDAPEFLNMTVFNRSNDLVWGMLGTNAVHFSFLLEYMAARLGLKVGKYHQVTSDLHAYTKTWEPEKWLADGTPDYYNPKAEDPYPPLDGHHTNSPAGVHTIPLVKNPECFERECRQLVQLNDGRGVYDTRVSSGRWEEPFFQTVAQPMFNAYHAYKTKACSHALRWADLIAAPDWRIAARGWIQRRLERKGVSV